MATTIATPPASRPAAGRSSLPAEERPFRPVNVWATVGAVFLAVEAYVIYNWFASGKAVDAPDGPTPIPDWMSTVARAWEICGIPVMLVFLYYFMIRPWRRQGRITLDGLLCIVFISMYWQDPLLNYFNNWYTYGSQFWNLGSWTTNVPGWMAPNTNQMPEPMIWSVPIYIYCVFGVVVLSNWVMRKAKERFPSLGKFGLITICYVFVAGFDMLIEPIFMRLGFWAYGGALEGWTINYGKYYQYPIYEGIVWGFAWTGWACLRYFKDDKGYTWAERGIEKTTLSPRMKTGVRFLALTGVCNLIFLFLYNVPIQFFALRSDPWPRDITSRSYLMNGLCGPGTTYACSEPDIPTPRGNSVHVAPDGTLIVPPHVKFPKHGGER